jgi:hypothetical protein
VCRAATRAVVCVAALVGALTWPSSYSVLWRIRLDIWGQVLLHIPFEPVSHHPALQHVAAGRTERHLYHVYYNTGNPILEHVIWPAVAHHNYLPCARMPCALHKGE